MLSGMSDKDRPADRPNRPSGFPVSILLGAAFLMVVLFGIGLAVGTDNNAVRTIAGFTFATTWAAQAAGTLIATAGAVSVLVCGLSRPPTGVSIAAAHSPLIAPAAVTLAGLALRGDGWSGVGLGLVAAVVAWRAFGRSADVA